MKLRYVCDSFFGDPIYRDQNGKLWVDMNQKADKAELYSLSSNEVDGEPEYPIERYKSYVGVEIEFSPFRKVPDIREHDYMMLSRLKGDCEYFLGHGGRYAGHLYYHNEQEHINHMKELHNSFPEGKKPEWLTWEQILEYERQMCGTEKGGK